MSERYKYAKINNDSKGRSRMTSVVYPDVQSIAKNSTVIESKLGDRYDKLAQEYYQDPRKWWVIAKANNSTGPTLTVEPGKSIIIPGNTDEIINRLRKINA